MTESDAFVRLGNLLPVIGEDVRGNRTRLAEEFFEILIAH
jgi:hypothetical protein